MEQKILEIINKKDTNKKYLIEKLEINTQEKLQELEITLENLIHSKKIFLNSKQKYSLITNDHIIATLEGSSKGRKYIRYNKEKIYIPEDKLHTALKNDLVVVELGNANLGTIVGLVKRKNNKLVCEVKEKNNKLHLVPFNGNCELSITTDKKLLKDFIIGDRVYIELDDYTIDDDNNILANNITKIGHFNDQFNDELAIAISKDFDIEFSKEAMKEAIEIPNHVRDEDKAGRIDLTKETVFTIDSIKTKDMDDAISIKKLNNGNYLLGVHIADVPFYIKPGSALFKEALKRGTSVYLGQVVIPMIPSILSNGICSLNEGVDRLTKSCFLEINPKGQIVNYKISDTIINSKKKMTYEELNELFKTGKVEDETYYAFLKEINLARELSNILTKSKTKRGNLDFESSDMYIKNDDFDKPQEFILTNNEEAEKIIENFMIIANEAVASHFYWRNIPFIYRVHNNPDEIKLDTTIELIQKLGYKLVKLQNAYGQKAIQNILKEYEGTPEYTIISNLLLRNMAKAKYSTENIGHFALALDNYCHFTSPIRRFPDLIVHTLINIFINDYSLNNHLKAFLDELEKICEHSSYKERQANDAEKDYLKLKMAEYMAEHINEEFEGMLLDIDKDKVYIKLNNNIKGTLDLSDESNIAFEIDYPNKELKCKHSKQKIKLGTKLLLKVTDVNIPQKEVYFGIKDLIKDKNNNTKKLGLKT